MDNELSKNERVDAEIKRMNTIFTSVGAKEKKVIQGLIQRAAYMRISLEDYEKDLDANGYIEMFTQSEKTEPYERERPAARLYNSMNGNYMKIMKQLSDFLERTPTKIKSDGFDEFVGKR